MSGLIWSGIGQGIANAGAAFGGAMMREASEEDRQRERQRELEERRAYERERDALYRRTADQQAAGRTGGGAAADGLSAAEIAAGGADEGMLARVAGLTVPEMRAVRKYSETGDAAPFKRDVTRTTREAGPEEAGYSDAVSRKNAQLVETTTSEMPPGFDQELRAKAAALAKIEESYRLGGKYDDVTKGRRNQQEVDASNDAKREPSKAGIIGQSMAAGGGKDLVGGTSEVTRNKFTGDTTVTPVGDAKIAEDRAQAGKAAAEGKAAADRKTRIDPADRLALQQEQVTASKLLESLQKDLSDHRKANPGKLEGPRNTDALQYRKELEKRVNEQQATLSDIQTALRTARGEKGDGAKPAPAEAKQEPIPVDKASGLPAPRSKAELDRLPSGTRFKAPDGSIKTRR